MESSASNQKQEEQVGSNSSRGSTSPWDPPEQWDTKRDMIYTRVLSADEFLGRMEETDRRLRRLSSSGNRSKDLKQIAKLLGYQGQSQDELLCIEAMLAEDDPELKCLGQFEQRYPKAVSKLRELNLKKGETKLSIQDTEVALVGVTLVETPTDTGSHTSFEGTGSDASPPSSSSIGVGTTAGQGQAIGIESDSDEQDGETVGQTHAKVLKQCIDAGDEKKADDALKMKHDEEESYVSRRFAEKLCFPRTEGDVDRLLNDHLLSMQALRSRQTLEKKRVHDMLELRKGQGLLGRQSQTQDMEEDDSADNSEEDEYGQKHLDKEDSGSDKVDSASDFHPQPTDPSPQDWDPPEKWDTKRDLIYTRVLSADEFLGRLEETDKQVRRLSSTGDGSQHLGIIPGLLGLRGHIQDELLRIEAMLAEDDPELECLGQFEQQYPKAVLKLRELNVKKEKIKLSTQDTEVALGGVTFIETSTGTGPHMTSTSTGTETSSPSLFSIGMGTTAGQGQAIGTQSDSDEQESKTVGQTHVKEIEQCIDAEDEKKVDDVLKIKHDEEENYVSQRFAEKLSLPRTEVSREDVDRLLDDHLLSMQALRNRQTLERKKVHDMLEVKKRQRLLARVDEQKEDDDSNDNSEEDGDFQKQQDKKDFRTSSTEDSRQSLERPEESIDKVDPMGHLGTDEEKKADGSVGTEELLQDISEMDKEFVENVLRAHRTTSDEEFAQLLKRHLSGVNELRKQRQSEKDRLAEMQGDDFESKADPSVGSFASMSSPRSVSVGTDAEESELDGEITRLDASFQVDLISKRKRMTDKEVEEFFEKHRQKRENLIRKQQSDRQDVKNKMKAELAAKVNKAKDADLRENSEKKLPSEEDEKFFHDLQRLKQNDALSKDAFAEMLQSFLDEREKNKKEERRKRQQDEEVSRSMASDIVHQHQQTSKQIQGMRQRQKEIADERMKAKLRARRKERETGRPTASEET